MMNAREYRSRSFAATARADLETDAVVKAHHHADAASWEALANMADRHAVVMATFKV
jgi:predicted dinucleotide-binding enzyme